MKFVTAIPLNEMIKCYCLPGSLWDWLYTLWSWNAYFGDDHYNGIIELSLWIFKGTW